MDQTETTRFTLVIPVYNRSDCILRCLNSIISQDYKSYEIIVIDDGSTDNTCNLIENYYSLSKFVKLIHYKDNKGVNFARNRGIEHTKGEYIIFLDSDDQLTNHALSNIDSYISQHPGYLHYLFLVSDRQGDPMLPKSIHEFKYEDWLSEKVLGDFMHIIRPSCFEGLPFVEEFRIYESLNWYRIFRRNKKQLFVPWITVDRERGRIDSVTKELALSNKNSLRNTYNYLNRFINWYKNDYIDYNLKNNLNKKIKTAILIGLSINETKQNSHLIKTLPWSHRRLIFSILNSKLFSPITYFLLVGYTQLKRALFE